MRNPNLTLDFCLDDASVVHQYFELRAQENVLILWVTNSQHCDLFLNVLSADLAGDLLFGHCSQECLRAEFRQSNC